MRKKNRNIAIVLAAVLSAAAVTGCGSTGSAASSGTTASASSSAEGTASSGAESADQKAADHVADLIDAIYVQERTADTDAQCKAAKEAWDALTDAQKELVNGVHASPDYFGLDTGDASEDDPLNSDDIGEKELLVVSFGTSYNTSRAKDIGGVEKALAAAYPDWSVRRAFTAQIIINHVEARDGEYIDNMDQALERAVDNGVKELIVQPTHLMHGAEYDELTEAVQEYADKFDSVKIAEPLLGEVGADTSTTNTDKENVAKDITATAVDEAGYDSLDAAKEDGTAFVFMGHGTSHDANITYDQMQTEMSDLGYDNVFIGTVEGEPEDTACTEVIKKVNDAGYKKVVLRPLMVVAGDHAHNDMAGDDDDSWKSQFEASGDFDSVTCQIEGLGEIDDIQQIYVQHTQDAIDSDETVSASSESTASSTATTLANGVYSAKFNTDSDMFKVNDVYDGRGTLTVQDGQMTIHITLMSDRIVNLYVGTAADAQKDGAELLQPTSDEVTLSDGTKETCNGFDVPVPAIGEEFDLAIVGTKGTWYDHKVSVTDPIRTGELTD